MSFLCARLVRISRKVLLRPSVPSSKGWECLQIGKQEYKTMDGSYEAAIIRTFAEFVKKDLVYRSKKPVYWSIPCRTALG